MKTVSVLALATIALASCSVDRAAAATCTMDQIEQALTVMMEFTNNADCLATQTGKCPNAKCLETMKAMAPKFPDCTAEGKNMKDEYAKSLKQCTSGSASARTSMVSAGVALASTVAAVAIAFL